MVSSITGPGAHRARSRASATTAATPPAGSTGGWFPPGRADVVPGGYRVTGHRAFASTCHHASQLTAMAVVCDDGAPRSGPDGSPALLVVFAPAVEATIVSNWDTLGMGGTGSHDVAMDGVLVPADHTCLMAPGGRERAAPCDGPLHAQFPWLLIATLGPIGVGLAQSALDELVAVAADKTPSYQTATLRDKDVTQASVGRAAAMTAAARTYVDAAVSALWAAAGAGRRATLAARRRSATPPGSRGCSATPTRSANMRGRRSPATGRRAGSSSACPPTGRSSSSEHRRSGVKGDSWTTSW
jgi:indole-3-acetate monooxygenase